MFISGAITFKNILSQGKVVEDTLKTGVNLTSEGQDVLRAQLQGCLLAPAGRQGHTLMRMRAQQVPRKQRGRWVGVEPPWGWVPLSSTAGSTCLGLPDLLVF